MKGCGKYLGVQTTPVKGVLLLERMDELATLPERLPITCSPVAILSGLGGIWAHFRDIDVGGQNSYPYC